MYAALWSLINGAWGSNQYIFSAEAFTAPFALVTSPVPNGAILNTSTLSLNWSTGTGVNEYWLVVGSSPGAGDLYSANEGTNLSQTLQVPVDGRRIYVEIWSLVSGSWMSASYYYDTTQ